MSFVVGILNARHVLFCRSSVVKNKKFMNRSIQRCSPGHKPDKFIEADATVPVLVDLVNQLLKISAVVSDATVPRPEPRVVMNSLSQKVCGLIGQKR